MAKDPAVLFYTSDFLTGTMLMTDEEVGQYIKLLCLQHQRGRLSKNHMLSICKTLDNEVLLKFKVDEQGLFYNERMELEALRRKNFTESRKNNGKKGGRPKKETKPSEKLVVSTSKPSEKLTEDENINENTIRDLNINSDKDFLLFTTEFNNDSWKETLCMNYSISLKDMDSYIKEFLTDRQSDESYKEQSVFDLKKWFVNFVKKKKEGLTTVDTTQSLKDKVLIQIQENDKHRQNRP